VSEKERGETKCKKANWIDETECPIRSKRIFEQIKSFNPSKQVRFMSPSNCRARVMKLFSFKKAFLGPLFLAIERQIDNFEI